MNRFYTWLSGKLKGGMGKYMLIAMLPTILAIILLYNTSWWWSPFQSVGLVGIVFAKTLNEPHETPSTLRKVFYLIAFALYCATIVFILWLAFFEYKIWQ